jgi:hypothetical protein
VVPCTGASSLTLAQGCACLHSVRVEVHYVGTAATLDTIRYPSNSATFYANLPFAPVPNSKICGPPPIDVPAVPSHFAKAMPKMSDEFVAIATPLKKR